MLRKLQIVFQNVAISEKKKWEYCTRIIPLNSLFFAFWRNFATNRKKKRKEKKRWAKVLQYKVFFAGVFFFFFFFSKTLLMSPKFKRKLLPNTQHTRKFLRTVLLYEACVTRACQTGRFKYKETRMRTECTRTHLRSCRRRRNTTNAPA